MGDVSRREVLIAATAAVAGFAAAHLLRRSRRDGPGDGEALDDVCGLVRPNIRKLEPYRCARDDYDSGVLLDANENAMGAVVDSATPDMHRYPCPYQMPLKERVAKFRGVEAENVFVGVGSDEAIDLLFRLFCEPRLDNVVITPPTYGMYKVCAAAHDVAVVAAPLVAETFAVDVAAVEAAVTPRTKIVFICSPGNPTAKSIPLSVVEQLLKSPKLSRCILVVDEAYVDFAATKSAAPLVKKYERLVVLHTLSKAFGLAAARVGTAIGDKRVIQYFNNVKAPYSINKLSSALAVEAFAPKALAKLESSVATLISERTKLRKALEAKAYVEKVFDSDANFLLFRLKRQDIAKPLYKALADAGVVIRFRGDQQHCAGCLRATIGTPAENLALLALLEKTISNPPFA
ncbi:pyridoxal phosphate-dependent transferase [Pelagophyceae sp. CCMP2097]|nr:pyridoxal phosphate-dependent transferase [Pelagophyceae sp. CCMP2097]|mmetsp:Transcript_8811/g.29056  ORF Transcript_8811/g.29056 Transcript_8811/m.29056 type:complete len:404 (-) Transcript_8811:60-1271(-)|eukprot:CAMPEP_0184262484 /NCGR_PEP_ID=MMETSP0977-20130417/15904_1 /TAXON_ID=483370 /ORGANISM="non described non described, Strain CCMP2097" /LENGTH=403 /DNA_ID=CAMNT_0026568165 /DNA_START=28 /DNA_END=1239 /DNA_ORIENTATION=+